MDICMFLMMPIYHSMSARILVSAICTAEQYFGIERCSMRVNDDERHLVRRVYKASCTDMKSPAGLTKM